MEGHSETAVISDPTQKSTPVYGTTNGPTTTNAPSNDDGTGAKRLWDFHYRDSNRWLESQSFLCGWDHLALLQVLVTAVDAFVVVALLYTVFDWSGDHHIYNGLFSHWSAIAFANVILLAIAVLCFAFQRLVAMYIKGRAGGILGTVALVLHFVLIFTTLGGAIWCIVDDNGYWNISNSTPGRALRWAMLVQFV